MWRGTQHTDYNGIVVFDPARLREYFGGSIRRGANLFREFTTTDAGDDMLRRGIVVPILAIDDAGYTIIIRDAHEPSPVEPWIVGENGQFPLEIAGDAVLADLAVFREWHDELDWRRVPIAPGRYGVTVRGFRQLAADERVITDAGYELVLAGGAQLPRVTASTATNMQTLRLELTPAVAR